MLMSDDTLLTRINPVEAFQLLKIHLNILCKIIIIIYNMFIY